MSELPITQKEYDVAVLMTDFLSKLRSYIENSDKICFFRFTPKIEGYEITIETVACKFLIQLFANGTIFSNKLKIIIIKDFSEVQNFISKSSEDNETILNELISLIN